MGRQAPKGLLGIHVNLPATVPPDVAAVIPVGGPAPAGLSEEERAVFETLIASDKMGNRAYVAMMTARPQNIGYGVTDSPAGLAAWLLGHPGFAKWTSGSDPEQSPTKDDVLDNITLYWLTNTGTSAARLYWENAGRTPTSAAVQKTAEISLPVAITVFPDEIYPSPRDLGSARLSPPDLLPRGRQGRTFRGMGAARTLCGRAPCRVPIAALIIEDERTFTCTRLASSRQRR